MSESTLPVGAGFICDTFLWERMGGYNPYTHPGSIRETLIKTFGTAGLVNRVYAVDFVVTHKDGTTTPTSVETFSTSPAKAVTDATSYADAVKLPGQTWTPQSVAIADGPFNDLAAV